VSTLVVSGSPSSTSRTARLASLVAERLSAQGLQAELLDLRALPAHALLGADFANPEITAALAQVASASGIVFATPVYKAAYSGLLKVFIDLLPQFGLRGKVVLPLVTGGSIAHVLAIDYALRPVLSSLDPLHIVAGLFVLDKHIAIQPDGISTLDPEPLLKLDQVIAAYAAALHRAPAREL
jgi:FMN reductase